MQTSELFFFSLLFFVVCFVVGTNGQQNCVAGEFYDSSISACAPCAIGETSTAGADVCFDIGATCRPGQLLVDAWCGLQCRDCVSSGYACPNGKGYHNERAGMAGYIPNMENSMTGCTGGTEQYYASEFAKSGIVSCGDSACPVGSFKYSNGCVACPEGTYSTADSNLQLFWGGDEQWNKIGCAICPPGLNSAIGSGNCLELCPPGTGVNATGDREFHEIYVYDSSLIGLNESNRLKHACVSCDEGYYNDGTSVTCMPCPPLTVSSKSATACRPSPYTCSPGEYLWSSSYDSLFGNAWEVMCKVCDVDRACPNGKHFSACEGSGGILCQSGKRADRGSVICTDAATTSCPAGSGNSGEGSMGCLLCAPGQYQSGALLSCSGCPHGLVSSTGQSNCSTVCKYGSLASNGDRGICAGCKSGYYVDEEKIVHLCVSDCPSAEATSSGEHCITPTIKCRLGSTLEIRLYGSYCAPCPMGYYCSESYIKVYGTEFGWSNDVGGPNLCPSGTSSDMDSAVACTSHFSTRCPAGSGKRDGVMNGCYVCRGGYYQPGSFLSCLECGPGEVSTSGSSSCASECPSGTGLPTSLSLSCKKCPTGHYQDGTKKLCKGCLGLYKPNDDNSRCSERCPYPYVSISVGGEADNGDSLDYNHYQSHDPPHAIFEDLSEIVPCYGINFQGYDAMASIVTFISVFYGIGLLMIPLTSGEKNSLWKWKFLKIVLGFIVYTICPVVDSLTDLAYLLTNDFFAFDTYDNNPTLAFVLPVLCGVTIIFSMLVFIWHLMKNLCMCKFRMVPLPKSLQFNNLDDLTKILSILPWTIMNAPFWAPWLLFGCLLYISKIFAVCGVANLWYEVWTGTNDYNSELFVDAKILNESIYTEIMYETFPQLIIQFINNTFLNAWSPLAIFSMIFSIFNAINGLYRLFFYKYIKKVPLARIPVHFELFGVTLIHIDPDNTDDVKNYYESKVTVAASDKDDDELDKQLFAGGELQHSGGLHEVEMVLRREKPGAKVSRHEFNMLKKIVLSLWRKVMMGSDEGDNEIDLTYALLSKNDQDKAPLQTVKGAYDLIDAPLVENEKDESGQDNEEARIVGNID